MNNYNLELMDSQNIERLNEAVMTLRHFVELSGKLLPFLSEISDKIRPNNEEQLHRIKIIKVFQSYNFDPQASQILMSSPILELINRSYEALAAPKNQHGVEAQYYLNKFQTEYRRLQHAWFTLDSN
jgi:hypothetical protein